MKKFITMFISAAVLMGSVSAEARVTLREAQQMRNEGKGIKMLRNDGIKQAPDNRLRTKSPVPGKIARRPVPKPTRKASAGVVQSGSDMFGYCTYSDIIQDTGPALYRLTPEGPELEWQDPVYPETGYTFAGGYLKDGIFKGYINVAFWGVNYGVDFGQINFETGESINVESLDLATAPVYNRLAYVPSEDMVYGFGQISGHNNAVFMSSEESNPGSPMVIAEYTDYNLIPVAFCYNQTEDAFFGIDMYKNFCRYDFDGKQTVLFSLADVDYGEGYVAGLCYSPDTNLYYWNLNKDDDAYMATIDPASGKVNIYEQLEHGNQFSFILTDEPAVDKFAPQRPEITEIGFPDGSLSGYVSYRLPTRYAGGDSIPADNVIFEVYTSFDGQVSKGSGKPGEVYKVAYENLSEGKHKFGCYIVAGGVESTQVKKTVYIGYDTPQAPKNVTLTENLVSWDAVPSVGVNNGYVSPDDVVYIVYLKGEVYGTTKQCSMPIELPADQPLGLCHVEVAAECKGKTSSSTTSNDVVAGQPLTIPVNIVPTADQSVLCSTYDGNNNGLGWTYNESGYFQIEYAYQGDGNQDDWLFLPPIEFDSSSKYYTFGYETAARSAYYPDESLEVYIGTSPNPSAMTQCLVDEYQPEPEVFNEVTDFFKVPQAGVYYIGFHCTSKENMAGINLRNIKVLDDNINDNSPAAVNDLKAVAFDKGVLKATVNFTFPARTVGGEELASDATLKATISAAETITVEGKPGESVSVVVATVQSQNRIGVRASLGDLNGLIEFVDVYTGVEAPATVSNLTAVTAPDMLSMTLTWDGPTEGYNGGYIVPEDVTYDIYMIITGFFGDVWAKIGETGTNTTYTYKCAEYDVQDLVHVGVVANNAAGNCGFVQSVSDVLGAPWTLPMDENFDNPDAVMGYTPWMTYEMDENNPVEWSIKYLTDIDNTFEPDHIGLVGTAAKGAIGALGVPRFTTKGYDDVTLKLNLYTGEKSADYTVIATYYGLKEPVVLSEIKGDNANGQFADYEVKLPAGLMGRDWVEIQIVCRFNSDDDVAILDSFLAEGSGDGSSVKSVFGNTAIFGGKGTITVRGFEGQDVTVSSLDGTVVVDDTAAGNEQTYTLSQGIYVVKAGDRKVKVMVK